MKTILARSWVEPMRRLRAVVLAILFVAGYLSGQSAIYAPRDLKILVIADEEFQNTRGWFSGATQMVRTAQSGFKNDFNIRITVPPFESWRSDDQLDRIDLLAGSLARDFDRFGADILVVLIGQKSLGRELSAFSLFKEGLIVLADPGRAPDLSHLLLHELGHLFGAVHVPASDKSAMRRFPNGETFDDVNHRIIILNRDRTFNKPDSPALPVANAEAMALYREVCASIKEFMSAKPVPKVLPDGTTVTNPPVVYKGQGLEDVFLLLAQILLNVGDIEEALSFCLEAARLNPDNLEAQNTLGIIYRRTGDFEKVVQKYLGIFREDPLYARAIFNMGVAYTHQGDLRAALGAYEAALAIDPAYAEPYNNIGEIFLRQGKVEQAEERFRKAIELKPADALAHSNLAEVLVRRRDFDGAAAEADKAVQLDPELVEAVVIQGNIDRGLGRTAEAVEHYLRARAMDPTNEKPATNLGICYFGRGEFAEAERSFREALAQNPASAEAHNGLGACLLKRHELDEAFREFNASLKLGLESAEVHLNLSSLALEKKSYDEAIFEAKLALGSNPELAEAYRNLGAAYLQKGLKRESEEAYAAAARIARDQAKRAV